MTTTVPQWTEFEFDLIRAGLAYAVVFSIRGSKLMRPDSVPLHPVGLARVVGLTWVGSRRFTDFSQWMLMLAAVIFATGRFEYLTITVMFVLMLVEVTYLSSHGAVNHGSHLVLVVLGAWFLALAAWWVDARYGSPWGATLADDRETTAVWWSIQGLVASRISAKKRA